MNWSMRLAKHLWQRLSAWISRTCCWFECINHRSIVFFRKFGSYVEILPVYHYLGIPFFYWEWWPVASIISLVSLKICELERIWPTQLGAMQHWRSKMLPWSTPLPTGHWRCIPPRPRWRFPKGWDQGISKNSVEFNHFTNPSNGLGPGRFDGWFMSQFLVDLWVIFITLPKLKKWFLEDHFPFGKFTFLLFRGNAKLQNHRCWDLWGHVKVARDLALLAWSLTKHCA